MIQPEWRRIAGFHSLKDGNSAAVWIAHDKAADTLRLYDACLFQREVFAVIAEGLIARGRWIPIAWHKECQEIADKLLERGCNMLPEPSLDSEEMAEVTSLDIQERMRTSRFKVDKRLQNWLDEFRSFYRDDSQVPRTSHPLMSATRHAVSQMDYARRQVPKKHQTIKHYKVAMI